MNLAYGQGGLKLEINIPPQHILAKSKGGLIIEGGIISSEYSTYKGAWSNDISFRGVFIILDSVDSYQQLLKEQYVVLIMDETNSHTPDEHTCHQFSLTSRP